MNLEQVMTNLETLRCITSWNYKMTTWNWRTPKPFSPIVMTWMCRGSQTFQPDSSQIIIPPVQCVWIILFSVRYPREICVHPSALPVRHESYSSTRFRFTSTVQFFINNFLKGQGIPKAALFDPVHPTETISALLNHLSKRFFGYKYDYKKYVKPAVNYVQVRIQEVYNSLELKWLLFMSEFKMYVKKIKRLPISATNCFRTCWKWPKKRA